jgi:DNA repair exonuclease SbcCD ATPase subunit
VTGHDNEHQNEAIELLREELKREKERTRELQTKLDTLSTSADNAEKEVLKFREERSRAEGLENEVQSLKAALENASGNGARAVELQTLRRNLEEEREEHEKARLEHEKRLAEMQEQKDNVDAQYQSLLGRVSTIRATLGERMKADAVGRSVLLRALALTSYRKSWPKQSRQWRNWKNKIDSWTIPLMNCRTRCGHRYQRKIAHHWSSRTCGDD